MVSKYYTLSRDGHDLGIAPEVPAGDFGEVLRKLTEWLRIYGPAGKWFVYSHEKGEDWETYRKLDVFIEKH